MAPMKDKWIRRFIITETTRHKKGFTIYKVTSVVFLKFSHQQVSKVSVWKRYNDFKRLHSELSSLHKRLRIKESFPIFPKSKYFGRFEAEVIEERKKYALKFLEFVGRYSYLYSSDIFIRFFETSHADNYISDCAQSLSSDTSEDDRIIVLNDSLIANDVAAQSTSHTSCLSKTHHNASGSSLSNICGKTASVSSQKKNESHSNATSIQNVSVKIREDQSCKSFDHKSDTALLSNVSGFDNLNNNISNHLTVNSIIPNEKLNLPQTQPKVTQYLVIAAAHISAAFQHESLMEYREAFTQYKLGILCLMNGVQSDTDSTRVPTIKDKISKYITRTEQLYNKHLDNNISIISKPVSELQYYKVLKIIKSVMLVTDMRTNCNRIIKTVEKSLYGGNTNAYILCEQIPHMVHLYAYIETETTVFLILQYASCGRLWDFIHLHYKVYDNLHINAISDRVCVNERVNGELDSNDNIDDVSKIDKVVEDNNQRDQHSTDSEIHAEVPTTQLLEKSQKLLQSVNATLKKSNFIANRLNEFKELDNSVHVNDRIENTSDKTCSSDVNISCGINETQYSSKETVVADEEQELWQIPEAVVRSWAAEILLALEALHQQDVLIRDFRPDNILLDDTGHVRLTYIVPQHNVELSKLTYPYSSPELMMFPTIPVTSATDIWSFGVILYELLAGITFDTKHPGAFHSHSTISIPRKLTENAKSLLYGILKYHPNERLTIDEIKRHQFFTEVDWSSKIGSQT
ncbi:ribosomal protein S6 kinase delta-1 [Pseudomyrmex gracilis]|uniref:ribosomal protein S6 kinase delta-1 n=1 Tax=Pseudomyrmex gracilis TaxID=219809 RepID=UPI000994C4C5|nr:ribosomal protein S6 kinase delta-1 [Pseudomyrmex gracilis]